MSRPGDDLVTLAADVGARLSAAGATVAVAESCTGGLLAATLTEIPGASEFFWGGAVVYDAAAKSVLAGVDDDLVRRHGTVSASTSEALAAAIRRRAGSTYGLAVTGWAGPAAGEGGLVGDVHAAVAAGDGTRVRTFGFDGDRLAIRRRAAAAALALLRERLETAQDGADD